MDDQGRHFAQDRRPKAKTTVKAGQGDKGDQKRRRPKRKSSGTFSAAAGSTSFDVLAAVVLARHLVFGSTNQSRQHSGGLPLSGSRGDFVEQGEKLLEIDRLGQHTLNARFDRRINDINRRITGQEDAPTPGCSSFICLNSSTPFMPGIE